MIKPFLELKALDISQFTQKKPTFYKNKEGKAVPTTEDKWLDYIEWAVILDLLYQNGAESVLFNSILHERKPNTLEINLTIDGKEYRLDYPVIDGNAIITQPNQMQIHKAELRGFVKAVAFYTGLGLSLWQKEERVLAESITDSHTAKINIKSLLEGAKTLDELNNAWKVMTESDQKKYKDVFTKSKARIDGV